MIHRIFVVPTRPDVPVDEAVDHWEQRHGAVFAATPHLAGYVQHRPSRSDQHRLGGRVCAEAWFDDRDAESRAWGSDHYRDVVTPDEERFVDRPRAWIARVVKEHALSGPAARPEGFEVVLTGCDPSAVPAGVGGRILELDRGGPDGGPPHVALLATVDEAAARSLADGLSADVVFVSTMATVLPPAGREGRSGESAHDVPE